MSKYLNLRRVIYFGLGLILIGSFWYHSKTIAQINAQSEQYTANQNKAFEASISSKIRSATDPYLVTKLGIFLSKQNFTTLALSAYKKGVDLDPKWRDGYWALANGYIRWANELVGLDSQNPNEYQKRIAQAKIALEKTLELDPTFTPAREALTKINE